MAQQQLRQRRRKIYVKARGRLVVVKRRGNKVKVVPRWWWRLYNHRQGRQVRTARFKVKDVAELLSHPPSMWELTAGGWIAFDFGESRYRIEYNTWQREGFRKLVGSGWRRVAKA